MTGRPLAHAAGIEAADDAERHARERAGATSGIITPGADAMGHAAHFLTRIERLSALQADLALALYRDRSLVSFILSRVLLPEGAERVALALERENGPHVIVARDGGFVTCLGAGMSVGATPVISRAQIDGLGDKFAGVRAGLAHARDDEELERLMMRLIAGGGELTREDFAVLRALAPVLGWTWMGMANDRCLKLEKQRKIYRRRIYRQRAPEVTDVLRVFWEDVWALGHLSALCSIYVEDLAGALPPADHEQIAWLLRPILHMASSTLAPSTVLRVAWGVSRIGRLFVPQYLDRLSRAREFIEVAHALVVLVSVGLRHEDVREQVSEAVDQNRERILALPDQEMSENERKVWDWVHRHCWQMLSGYEQEYVPQYRQYGAECVLQRGAALPPGHPQRWDTLEAVPGELAVTMVPSVDESMMLPSENRVMPFIALPWVIAASADELYVPEQYMDAYGTKFDRERMREMLDRHARFYGINQPVQAEGRPGRNQPCPCGSGKKYKRCCGAAT